MATPIGNLRDVTLRALDVLAGVDRVLAEDTRRTRKLLSHYGIGGRLEAYHEHNEESRTPRVVERIRGGESAALVTDAGMPSVSDPGYRLARAAAEAGVPVVPVPGASAPLAALVASGLPTDRFAFVGYAPRKAGERRDFLQQVGAFPGTAVLFESPRRLRATLEAAVEVLGRRRPAALARELTKAHEEFVRGDLGSLLAALPDEVKGEITLCIGPDPGGEAAPVPGDEELRRRHRELVASGMDRKEALRLLARETGLRRRDLYETVLLGGSGSDPTDGETER